MAQKPAVHIELRGEEWAVVREGNKRATSTHPTQSEAAERGRDLARRYKSEFFLHAQDGQIREHRDYREGQPSADEGIVDTVSETVGTFTDVVGGTTGVAAQAAGGASQETETTADREEDRDDSVAHAASGGERTRRGVREEVRGLTGSGRAEPMGKPEERYAEYGIYDQYGERIGPLSDLFVDENDEPEYVGVETGLPGNRSVLVPAEAITVDDRVRRSEEEISVETREREAGEMRVRKRVRTERERLTVPKKHVEVTVERVPVEGAVPEGNEAATAPQIGEEEIVVPVVGEEIEIDDQTGRDTGSNKDPK